MSRSAIPHPKYPGAPSRMADGRLFTDYRPNCDLMPSVPAGAWGDWERNQNMMQTGLIRIQNERSMTVLRAGSLQCVDTMVPELQKRVCSWNGCTTLPGHAVGIGSGRLYLPGSPQLAGADPDRTAQATFPEMAGTFSANPQDYVLTRIPNPPLATVRTPTMKNRYSAPYAN
jgi:hypothetical protein